jgi:hypothetical protein
MASSTTETVAPAVAVPVVIAAAIIVIFVAALVAEVKIPVHPPWIAVVIGSITAALFEAPAWILYAVLWVRIICTLQCPLDRKHGMPPRCHVIIYGFIRAALILAVTAASPISLGPLQVVHVLILAFDIYNRGILSVSDRYIG